MNIFEQAIKKAVRFETQRGVISAEQLYDMKLTSKDGFDLDTLAKAVNRDLKATEEESFVATNSNPARGLLELKLELVKHVIAEKLAEKAAKENVAAAKAEEQKLLEVLARKQDSALENLTEDQIKERIAATRAAAGLPG